MISLLVKVLPLAFGAAISPTLLTVVVLLLAGAKSRRPAVAFAAGTAVLSVAIGAAVLLVFRSALDAPHHVTGHRGAVVDMIFGGLLLALAARAVASTPRPKEPKPRHLLGVGAAFVLGLGIMASNFSSLVLYLAALKEIVRADATTSVAVVVTGVFITVMLLPVELPLLLTVVAPRSADRLLGCIGETVTRHSRTITIVVLVGFGAYLFLKGISRF